MSTVKLRLANQEIIEGRLKGELSATEFAIAEATWALPRQNIREKLAQGQVHVSEWPESLHWSWSAKAPLIRRLEVRGAGVSAEGFWQGLILTKSASYAARLGADRGKPLIYVDYIEVAPWNWSIRSLGQLPRFRGLGSILFADTVRQSFAEGFSGRVGLHSLPQAEGFYQKVIGMTAVGRDETKQNLLYLELSSERARLLLDREKVG